MTMSNQGGKFANKPVSEPDSEPGNVTLAENSFSSAAENFNFGSSQAKVRSVVANIFQPGLPHNPLKVIQLQRLIGNKAVTKLIKKTIQRKLVASGIKSFGVPFLIDDQDPQKRLIDPFELCYCQVDNSGEKPKFVRTEEKFKVVKDEDEAFLQQFHKSYLNAFNTGLPGNNHIVPVKKDEEYGNAKDKGFSSL